MPGVFVVYLFIYFIASQLKARCDDLKLDWSSVSLESLLKEKQALRSQISEKQRHCLELQVGGAHNKHCAAARGESCKSNIQYNLFFIMGSLSGGK